MGCNSWHEPNPSEATSCKTPFHPIMKKVVGIILLPMFSSTFRTSFALDLLPSKYFRIIFVLIIFLEPLPSFLNVAISITLIAALLSTIILFIAFPLMNPLMYNALKRLCFNSSGFSKDGLLEFNNNWVAISLVSVSSSSVVLNFAGWKPCVTSTSGPWTLD
jgi:hypothetical protein